MPGLNVGYLSYNVQKKPLDDVKVRQALTYAVNKDAIIKAVYQGAGVSAKNLIPPTMWGYNDDVQDYTYDPEKAKALLKARTKEAFLMSQYRSGDVLGPIQNNC